MDATAATRGNASFRSWAIVVPSYPASQVWWNDCNFSVGVPSLEVSRPYRVRRGP